MTLKSAIIIFALNCRGKKQSPEKIKNLRSSFQSSDVYRLSIIYGNYYIGRKRETKKKCNDIFILQIFLSIIKNY